MSNCIDMLGLRFGMLTVASRAENDSSGSTRWNVRCDCGRETVADGRSLRKGIKTNCGCQRKKAYSEPRLCEYCGNPVHNRSYRFCGPSCAARARHGIPKVEIDRNFNWEQTSGKRWKCRYQRKNVSCTDRDCAHCGWNPEVARKRSEEIAQKRKETAV